MKGPQFCRWLLVSSLLAGLCRSAHGPPLEELPELAGDCTEDDWAADSLKVSLMQTRINVQRSRGPAEAAADPSRPVAPPTVAARVHTKLKRWERDVFGGRLRPRRPEEALSKAVSVDEWLLLIGVVVALTSVDYFVLRRADGGVWHHAAMVCFWILAGAAYNMYVGARYGDEAALDWCTGWVLEWILSFDNLFLFHVLFRVFKTPEELRPKALFCGIVGAFVLRLIMILLFDSLIERHGWVRLLFGTFLIYSGIVAVQVDDDDAAAKGYSTKPLKYIFGDRLEESYNSSGTLFPVGVDGRMRVSMLAFVIFCVEVTDVVFAIDSVSAKVAQLPNQFIVFSSSVLALCGLRAMFFILEDAVEYFEYLKYGICIVLLFIGLELILAPFVHLDSWTVLIVIVSVCVVSMLASTAKRVRGASSQDALPAMMRDAWARDAG